MLRRLRNALAAVLVAFASITIAACNSGGDGSTGVNPPPVDTTAKPPTLVSFSIVGDTTIVAPTKKQYHSIAKYSDGTEKDVSSLTTFNTTNYVVADVTSTGLAIPARLGSFQVTASFATLPMVSFPAKVVGTPWSQLPSLTVGGKVLVQGTIASNGMIWSFVKGLTTVWHDPVIPHQNMVDAMELIRSADSTGKFTYAFVADSASARWQFGFVQPSTPPVPAGHCGWAGSGTVVDNTLTEGRASILRIPVGCMNKDVLAHEGFHMLGLMVHTPPDTDILSSSGIIFRVSVDLRSAVSFLQVVDSGVIPINP